MNNEGPIGNHLEKIKLLNLCFDTGNIFLFSCYLTIIGLLLC